MRWLALVAGFALTALAFAAATRVADTREGLISEVVTLLGGLAGVSLLIYAFTARKRPAPPLPAADRSAPRTPRPRSANDALLGGGGIALALLLLAGLVISGGVLWAALGLTLMLPMISGCVYLCVRFLRSTP